ncbi:MAG: hypothetical protein JOY71_08535 [Acetobacteraceae bacterium]|nr:hypothetical protein [Acetobacteraceae bacterium]MBV8592472.1 hypothetical protein [Acetobacteraceae bacterium]
MQEEDLTLHVAVTDAKATGSKRPSAQANPDCYGHVVEGRPGGIGIRGKAIVTPRRTCMNSW